LIFEVVDHSKKEELLALKVAKAEVSGILGFSHGHSSMTNRGGNGVVGSLGFSSSNNGVGGSTPSILPTAAVMGNCSAVPGLGVSPILGNAGPRITSSMENMIGGGLSMAGLAYHLNLVANSGSGNLSVQSPNRQISGVLQQASLQLTSHPNSAGGSQGQLGSLHKQGLGVSPIVQQN